MGKSKSWDNWENIAPIAEGGMGRVFQVKNRVTGKIGALKVLKNKERIDRFKSEVDAVKKLVHPDIVALLDANLDKDPFYAVYEFEKGGSLGAMPVEELVAKPLSQRLKLCEQICVALQFAHESKIIHRDVKPDNILISADFTKAKLCDFGLMFCDEENIERQTKTMEQVGSRYYIPPELADGRADQITSKADIYSMGKVLYYIISGKIFDRERHREVKYNLTLVLNDPFLEAISKILDVSIVENLESRLSSAGEMKSLIEQARNSIVERKPIPNVLETYICVFCRNGIYQKVCTSLGGGGGNSGYKEGNVGEEHLIYFECDNCGNSQRFKIKKGEKWFPEEYNHLKSR